MAKTINLASALAAQRRDGGSRPTSLLPTRIQTISTETNDLGMLEPRRRGGRNPFASEPEPDEGDISSHGFTKPAAELGSFSSTVHTTSNEPRNDLSKLHAAIDETNANFRDGRLRPPSPATPGDFDIIVDNVDPFIGSKSLLELFQSRFKSCSYVEKIRNYFSRTGDSPATFNTYRVVFSNEKDQQRALVDMQGVYSGNRPMTIMTDAEYYITYDAPKLSSKTPNFVLRIEELGPEVNEYLLLSLFRDRFESCKSARIYPGLPLKSATVSFSDQKEWQSALLDMNGVYCGNTPIVIGNSRPEEQAALKDEVSRRDARRRDVFLPASDIRTVLERVGLEAYVETFRNEGFETWEQLLDITESDL
jgi:hypothetical protein